MESDASFALAEENRRLKRAVEELSILNDLSRAIAASLNSHDIMQTIIHRSLRAVQAEQGVITLVDQQTSDSMKTLVRSMVSSSDHQKFHFDQSLLGWMHLNKKPLMLNDPRTDDRFHGVRFDDSIESLLAVPMLVKSELKGVLTIYNKKNTKKFTEEDQRLLAIIAAQSAQVVENARLYEGEQALLRMQEEVRLAARIQLDLLPKSLPPMPGYDVAGKSVPAQMVGGDYFDFIPVTDNRFALCLGDVSGKGLPASLLMANLQATLRAQAVWNISSRECVARANTLLYNSTSAEKFVTLFYGLLDTQTHQLDYSNAGHNPPLLFSSGNGFRLLETGGTVLSVMESFPYENQVVPIDAGGMLVIYSDGVTEAMNSSDDQFGEERLIELIKAHRTLRAQELIDIVITEVRKHTGDAPQTDDITLVVVKRIS